MLSTATSPQADEGNSAYFSCGIVLLRNVAALYGVFCGRSKQPCKARDREFYVPAVLLLMVCCAPDVWVDRIYLCRVCYLAPSYMSRRQTVKMPGRTLQTLHVAAQPGPSRSLKMLKGSQATLGFAGRRERSMAAPLVLVGML